MRRPLVLQALSGAVPFARLVGLAGAAGLVACIALAACGGNDKPPLTPDNLDPSLVGGENAEAGAPTTPSTPTPPSAK
jgi:hypothetical protein